ncbi:hypothetical protein LNI90_03715 [Tenacibaculum dicentrarchi]|nr:hypothetical protein [Tenacibaculum dicentrarchi]MCD8424387.1 hypothetical protein [Tenacibaculum dicentrarchi]MCD8441692.1 hypothetical protein [Tenacibaculum dicentrarchi]MCD8448778.1 hypothetical protein [Tenacibaculum dicentrarchi]MCD8451182.1 hypothetical protein [Tenacibaculum dicentrarchi]
MQKIIYFIILITFSNFSYAQIFYKVSKDIDFDTVTDTIYIDYEKGTIVCKLSSLNFKKTESKLIELTKQSGIEKSKNGFKFKYNGMRAGYSSQFEYNKQTKKIQLITMSRYEYGNVVNDGSGKSKINLLSGKYVGDWKYYDDEKEKLKIIPRIKTKICFNKTYLNTFSENTYYEYTKKCSKLYRKFREIEMKKNKNI